MITVEEYLAIAKEKGASDLHIAVGVPPKCRINGELVSLELERLSSEEIQDIISPILTKYAREILEEAGEVDFAYTIPKQGRYRVNIFRQRGSYSMVIRLVGTIIPSPEEIGLPQSVVELCNKKRGLILVTGPTGSGKSTTLASLIDQINCNQNAHIITLEDPIEYLHSHKKSIVNQREIGLDTKSYANALRAALREDPDVILAGEMRELDTIATAITAAETGHLVFSTLHTIGAEATIQRIIEVFSPNQQQQIRVQLACVLEAVISQQLIPSFDEKKRIAAYEIMYATPMIKNLIREGKINQINSTIQANKKLDMQTMDDAIYDLYLERKIESKQALLFAQDIDAMEKKLV